MLLPLLSEASVQQPLELLAQFPSLSVKGPHNVSVLSGTILIGGDLRH